MARLDAHYAIDGRLFHNIAPLYETLFCPFEGTFFGSLRSVAVRLRLYQELVQLASNRSERYCVASLFTDLKTITFVSLWIRSSIVFQPKISIRGLLGASYLLPVIILAVFSSEVSAVVGFRLVHKCHKLSSNSENVDLLC